MPIGVTVALPMKLVGRMAGITIGAGLTNIMERGFIVTISNMERYHKVSQLR